MMLCHPPLVMPILFLFLFPAPVGVPARLPDGWMLLGCWLSPLGLCLPLVAWFAFELSVTPLAAGPIFASLAAFVVASAALLVVPYAASAPAAEAVVDFGSVVVIQLVVVFAKLLVGLMPELLIEAVAVVDPLIGLTWLVSACSLLRLQIVLSLFRKMGVYYRREMLVPPSVC